MEQPISVTRSNFNDWMVPVFAPANFIPVRGEGSRIWDQENKEYIDFAGGIAVNALGHAHPVAVNALTEQATKLWHVGNGYTNEPVLRLAKQLTENTFADKVFFCNSGAEANEAALKLARKVGLDSGVAGKSGIVAFNNAFHGRTLFTVSAGGQPKYSQDFAPLPNGINHVAFNDLEAAKAVINEQTCAVIVEPIQGEGGVIPADIEFLKGLRALCDEFGALLIFDEVMTGFRVGYNCAQGYFGVTPDLTCLGKVIGGGLPVGAFGGKKEIMDQIAPVGNIYQAGTLSGNPLAMTSGYETLSQLTPESYEYFQKLGDILEKGLKEVFAKHNVPITVNRAGSMIGYFLNKGPVTNFEEANQSDLELFSHMYREMAKEGVFLPPSQFEGTFLSTAHTKDDIEKTIQAFDNALSRIV